jgi:cyclic pyranopterin phosphate synthase
MPEEEYAWLEREEVLSFEELYRVAGLLQGLGVDRVRLTGGEPLVRRELPSLIAQLAARRFADLALTTNGVLLAPAARALRDAGLHRLTVSLDTLSPSVFLKLTRRDSHARVLEGLAEAAGVGFPGGLKLDTVLVRGVNDGEVLALLDYAATLGAELRFIEYMDVGGATHWSREQVVTRAEVLAEVSAALGALEPLPGRGSAPAERFRLPDGRTFGVVASTSQPFCGQCDRARLTADGTLLTCLYARAGVDLKAALRGGETDDALTARLREIWSTRADRGAEQRLALRERRGPLASALELKGDLRREMHTRGG